MVDCGCCAFNSFAYLLKVQNDWKGDTRITHAAWLLTLTS